MDPVSASLVSGVDRSRSLCLMYHSICDQGESVWELPVGRFREHLDVLREQGWVTATLSDLVVTKDHDRPAVAITFDDGYKNNLEAVEELLKRGMTATIYPIVNELGSGGTAAGANGIRREMLSGQDLVDVHRAGIEIGSHGLSHRRFDLLEDSELNREITDSRRDLEAVLGDRVRSIAYPFGRYDARTLDMVRAAGYANGCCTEPGTLSAGFDPYRVKRLSIFSMDGPGRFARKLALAANDVGWAQVGRYYSKRLLTRLPR